MTGRPSTPAEPPGAGQPRASAETSTSPAAVYPPDENPFPNPPPARGDRVPSHVVSAGGALRRSLLIWGWGQLAAGDRRGWLGPPSQVAAVVGLVLAAPYAASTAAPIVYLALAGAGTAWVAIAVHAWRHAARRRDALGEAPGSGAAGLLWLAPLAVVAGAGFWIVAGDAAEPGLVLDGYLEDWRNGQLDSAAARFATATPVEALAAAWQRQDSALRNAAVRIVAAEPASLVDPDRPAGGLRWIDLGVTAAGERAFIAEIARDEMVRDHLFGLLPTTSRRLVAVEQVGRVEIRAVEIGRGAFGPIVSWRLVRVEVAGERFSP
ncbi:MAG TPA: hypothetical protein VM344_07555 [Vitreimonas sp.]|nr:hypothetical protein [Vitreimonas sp.]